MHRRKKIEVIIESPARSLVLDMLDRNGATGYTVLPTLCGRGLSAVWDSNPLTDALNQVVVIAIVSSDVADRIIAEMSELLVDHHGVVTVADVEVVRGERF